MSDQFGHSFVESRIRWAALLLLVPALNLRAQCTEWQYLSGGAKARFERILKVQYVACRDSQYSGRPEDLNEKFSQDLGHFLQAGPCLSYVEIVPRQGDCAIEVGPFVHAMLMRCAAFRGDTEEVFALAEKLETKYPDGRVKQVLEFDGSCYDLDVFYFSRSTKLDLLLKAKANGLSSKQLEDAFVLISEMAKRGGSHWEHPDADSYQLRHDDVAWGYLNGFLTVSGANKPEWKRHIDRFLVLVERPQLEARILLVNGLALLKLGDTEAGTAVLKRLIRRHRKTFGEVGWTFTPFAAVAEYRLFKLRGAEREESDPERETLLALIDEGAKAARSRNKEPLQDYDAFLSSLERAGLPYQNLLEGK